MYNIRSIAIAAGVYNMIGLGGVEDCQVSLAVIRRQWPFQDLHIRKPARL